MFVPPYLDIFLKNYSGKEVNKLFRKSMKMRDLEFLGVPSYIVDIWEKHYSPYLLPVQEKAVRHYGVLDYNGNDNLLVLSPTSSGKTFIGEMAAVAQAVHRKKIIYLVPLRSLAEEKYRHFKDLYSDCNIHTLISSRDHREYDKKIIRGDYQVAVMVYEKFNYFLLEYPDFLRNVSLVIIDEMQMINDPVRGPLLEEIVAYIKKNKPELKIIGLSAYLDNEAGFLNWISADCLLSYQRPVELRKGMVRGGTFKYITHNNYFRGEETFFSPDEVRENSYEDYLKQTVSYFVKKDEPTLLFLPTRKDTRRWASWLAGQVDAPRAEGAIAELSRLEETRSRDELLYLLEKGISYHNADLSWEERNLVENYLRSGEIKLICATTTLAMGINLPFKNVILSTDKYTSDDGNYRNGYFTSLSMTDVENMGGRAGRLNRNQREEKDNFGRAIFLADSLFSETILQNLYFNALKSANPAGMPPPPRINDPGVKYNSSLAIENPEATALAAVQDTKTLCRPLKKEKDFINFLLREIARGINTKEKLDNRFKGLTSDLKKDDHYWVFNFEEDDLKTEIKKGLERLIEYDLVKYDKKDKDAEKLSLTGAGVLINSRGIGIDTYLLFKEYLENKRGKLTNLELITLLTKSDEGKNIPIPFPQFNLITNRYNRGDWKYYYQNRMLKLVSNRGEDGKEIYQDILELNENEEDCRCGLDVEDYLSIKKTLLLYDWIGDKEIKEIEEAYKIYGGAIRKLGEVFSWLADSLGGIAEDLGWRKKENKKKELAGIKKLSERLAWGVEEEGLKLARQHIPGLGRSYIRALLREGYDDGKCLEELSEEELAKVVPKRLAGRIKERFSGESCKANTLLASPEIKNCKPETRNPKPVTILEIDTHRPDRIIFEGEKIGVTATEFSLIHLLALHNEQVMSYEGIVKKLWGAETEAIYTRIIQHIYKFRKNILNTIGNNPTNREKIRDTLKVVPGRGVMLNINDKELKIN